MEILIYADNQSITYEEIRKASTAVIESIKNTLPTIHHRECVIESVLSDAKKLLSEKEIKL